MKRIFGGKVKKKIVGEENWGWVFGKIKEFGGEVERDHREEDVGRLREEIEIFFFLKWSREI